MKYIDYKENRRQGTFDFPVAFYHLSPSHPRYQMPYHWHLEYEIIRILSGSLFLTLDGRSFEARENDVIFLQDGVLHGGIPSDCIYECIVFDMKFLLKDSRVCAKQMQGILSHTNLIDAQLSERVPSVRSRTDILFQAMREKNPGFEFITLGILYQILGTIIDERAYTAGPANRILISERLQHIKNVLDHIEKNYTENISLDQLARIAGMSPKYFCRYFREITQRSPIDYLNYYRIECACEQLTARNVSVTEAAMNCGFHDTSYFVKMFHRYKGITPKQYLKINF